MPAALPTLYLRLWSFESWSVAPQALFLSGIPLFRYCLDCLDCLFCLEFINFFLETSIFKYICKIPDKSDKPDKTRKCLYRIFFLLELAGSHACGAADLYLRLWSFESWSVAPQALFLSGIIYCLDCLFCLEIINFFLETSIFKYIYKIPDNPDNPDKTRKCLYRIFFLLEL